MSVYEDIDPKIFRSIMKSKSQHNNASAVVLDKEMSLEEKVQALGSIQKEMAEREQETINSVWGEMIRNLKERGRDRPINIPTANKDWVHAMLKGSFDMATGKQPEWDIESGNDEEYEPDLTLAIYVGKILVLYEKTYPEYC